MLRYWLRLDDMGYEISADDMSIMGYFEVPKKPEPHPEVYTWDINTWGWVVDKDKAIDAITKLQTEKETSGVKLGEHTFGADNREKLLLIMYASKAVRDTAHTFYLKTIDGVRIELSGEDVIALHDKVIDRTEFCFNRAGELEEALENGTFHPSMIDEGWIEEIEPEADPAE